MIKPFQLILMLFCITFVSVSACSQTDVPQTDPPGDLVAEGERVFNQQCTSCHAKDADTIIVGPALGKIGAQAGLRVQNQDGRQYIEIAIMQPGEYMVEGYPNVMPPDYAKRLSDQEIDALVAYLLSLK